MSHDGGGGGAGGWGLVVTGSGNVGSLDNDVTGGQGGAGGSGNGGSGGIGVAFTGAAITGTIASAVPAAPAVTTVSKEGEVAAARVVPAFHIWAPASQRSPLRTP
jgi:hypothetical protein